MKAKRTASRDEAFKTRDYNDEESKPGTLSELRDVAMRELKVSKNAFDFGWVEAIERTGRQDWYEPLRRRFRKSKSQ